MSRALAIAAFLVPLAALAQAPPAPPTANSPLFWEVREGTHPRMGAIVVAVPSSSVVTPVGKEKILSLVFFSCEKSRGKIAIELANAAESDQRSGLYPKQMPRIFCNPRSTAPRVELPASWYVSEIGDALARNLAPADLRRCASIEIGQDIALPRGWGPETKHIDIELIPYKKELESVLATCTAASTVVASAPPPTAAGPAAPAKAAPAPPAKAPAPAAPTPSATPSPPPKIAAAPAVVPPKAAPEPAWRAAHTSTEGGRSNVRAGPSLDAAIVSVLNPGLPVYVQTTGTEWWKVKPRAGNAFGGYIRADRLTFD